MRKLYRIQINARALINEVMIAIFPLNDIQSHPMEDLGNLLFVVFQAVVVISSIRMAEDSSSSIIALGIAGSWLFNDYPCPHAMIVSLSSILISFFENWEY